MDLIQQAAARAGLRDAWIAEDIARGIVLYFKERFTHTSISIEEFFHKIDGTLRAIGFADVAGKLRKSAPPAEVVLSRVAEEAGAGYELRFFQLLNGRLEEARRRGTTQVFCLELREAVTSLCAAKRWNRRCEELQAEILDYLALGMTRQSEEADVTILVR